jgi:hypothetical protein
LDLALAIVTLVSLIFALFTGWQNRRASVQLNEILNSLSTRFLGEYPKHIPEIVEALPKARSSVKILCDAPAYGAYANSELHLRYVNVIEELDQRRDVEVTMIYPERGVQDRIDELYFEAVAGRFDKHDQSEQERCRLFWLRHGPRNAEKAPNESSESAPALRNEDGSLNVGWILEEMQRVDQRFVEGIRHATKIALGDEALLHVQAWIIDDQVAIFTFANALVGEDSERSFDRNGQHCFHTTDKRLIESLKGTLTLVASHKKANGATSSNLTEST